MKNLILICILFLSGCFQSSAIGEGTTYYNNKPVSKITKIKKGDVFTTKKLSNFKVISTKDNLIYLSENTTIQFLELSKIVLKKGKVLVKGELIILTPLCGLSSDNAQISVLYNKFVTVVKIYKGSCRIVLDNKIFKHEAQNTLLIKKNNIIKIKFNSNDKKIEKKDLKLLK